MGIFRRNQSKSVLIIDDFRLETTKSEVKVSITPEFLELLQKDGYALDSKAGSSSSEIETATYMASYQLWDIPVKITFDNEGIDNKDDFVKSINVKLDWLEGKKEQVYKKLAAGLLELKNTNWLEEDEASYNEKTFISNIKIHSLDFTIDGRFELLFNENMIFGGHDISMTINSKLEMEDPTI